MKPTQHKQELSKLSLIWFQLYTHWWSYTHQNDNQPPSKYWTTFACQL